MLRLWTLLCVTALGCQNQQKPKPAQRPGQQIKQLTQVLTPLSNRPSLDKYQPRPSSSRLPVLTKTKTKTKPDADDNRSAAPISLTVTIESVSLANGETADQFPGLVPNERFFLASYTVVDESTGEEKPDKEYRLRLKTNEPKSLIGRLGQPVKVIGRWVHMGQTAVRVQNARQKLPRALDLQPLKGQDLVEAAERQRARFIRDSVGSESDGNDVSKSKIFLERRAVPKQARALPPLFHVSKVVPLKGKRFDPKLVSPPPR
ncbi:MAG: hypothetical protein VYA30_09495 [Myxococcota bacterium]|nr:hypothetical protein [Myxococcota bacterium]